MRNVIIVFLICLTAGYIFYTYNYRQEVQIALQQTAIRSDMEIDDMVSSLRAEQARIAKAKAAEKARQMALAEAKKAAEAQAAASQALEKNQAEVAEAQTQTGEKIAEVQKQAADTLEQAESSKKDLSDAEGVTAALPKSEQ